MLQFGTKNVSLVRRSTIDRHLQGLVFEREEPERCMKNCDTRPWRCQWNRSSKNILFQANEAAQVRGFGKSGYRLVPKFFFFFFFIEIKTRVSSFEQHPFLRETFQREQSETFTVYWQSSWEATAAMVYTSTLIDLCSKGLNRLETFGGYCRSKRYINRVCAIQNNERD